MSKVRDYRITRPVKVGAEFHQPNPNETLILALEEEVGDSLVEQGAAELVVKQKFGKGKTDEQDEKDEKAGGLKTPELK